MEHIGKVDNRWIFSRNLDFVAHALPILVGCLAAPFLWAFVDPNELPLWGYLIVVVFCDVGHVWGTIFRCYLDTGENRRRWALYNVAPAAIFGVSFALHFWVSEQVFWTAAGYFAIFHFVRQQWGFLCLYRARAKEVEGRWVDRAVHLAGALSPLALWHADPNRTFDWFMRDDPLPLRLPSWSSRPICAAWLAIAAAYSLHLFLIYRSTGRFNPGKVATMAFSWFTWAVGVLCPHKLLAVFFLNTFHAAPSYMIVFFTGRNKWRIEEPPTQAEKFIQWCTRPGNWGWYLAFFVTIAVFEEVLWEAFVWRDYFPGAFGFEVNALGKSFFTSLLALPQITHYFLDAFIWKIESNPGLSDHYGLTYTVNKKLQ